MGRNKKISVNLKTTEEQWDEGRLLVVTTQETFPVSSEALMCRGFIIILLNMTFGLLPITVSGSQIKYFRCSVSQLYAFVFAICIIILSITFVQFQLVAKLSNLESVSGTGIILNILVKIAHVCGFMLLMIRGHWMAKRFPMYWSQLAKLLQKSVLDYHGLDSDKLRMISHFSRSSVVIYIVLMTSTNLWSMALDNGVVRDLFANQSAANLIGTSTSSIWYISITIGYIMWELCNLSHILVTMLLCFIVCSIIVCLRSINEEIREIIDTLNKPKYFTEGIALVNAGEATMMTDAEEKNISKSLDKFRMCYALCQDLTTGLSSAWGISIILEVLVAVIMLLGNFFEVLKKLYPQNAVHTITQGNVTMEIDMPSFSFGAEDINTVLQCVTVGFTHFYFLYKLTVLATDMTQESQLPSLILNMASNEHWPVNIRNKIQFFKMDISNMPISLSAANYFEVNKYLISCLFGCICTYLIVLLQFTQTESMGKGSCSGSPQ